MHLLSAYEDTLDVMEGDRRIGQVVLQSHGWATYRVTENDRVIERRIATEPTIEEALSHLRNAAS